MEKKIEPIEAKDEQQVDTYWIVANIHIHVIINIIYCRRNSISRCTQLT